MVPSALSPEELQIFRAMIKAKTDAETQTASDHRLADVSEKLSKATEQLSGFREWYEEVEAVLKRQRLHLTPGYAQQR